MTRWLVTGAAGMLGRDVVDALAGRAVNAASRRDLDITDSEAVTDAVNGHDVVVHCAAWTAVDDAETHEAQAFSINATAVATLARACARTGSRLLTISTDYVFAGDADRPYAEDAPLGPRSAYGRTKAAGEWAVRAELPDRHWIVRTAWLYGEHGPSFVRTMAALERSRETVDVVDDQRGQPTWTRELAARLVAMVDAEAPAGTYHGTAAGSATWCDLARAVFRHVGADPDRVRPTTSAAFARPAPRPAWSVLGHDAWLQVPLPPMRDWQVALDEAVRTGGVLEPVAARAR